MKSHAKVVVIGGGVVGCSILYHLAKLGCSDALLIERSELTSGSTWHAAAGMHAMHDVTNIAKLQKYTINLYKELEAETGQSCGIHNVGGLYLAASEERTNQLRLQRSKARYLGIDFEMISLKEAQEMNPLLNLEGVHCAMFEPNESHVDPSGVTHAYAKGARMMGASIERFCPVIETNPRADGGWDVVTEKGTVVAETVVNAAGLWGREVAALAGIDLPLMPMEHQYFVTETIPEIEALGRELPLLHDNDLGYYLRQEGMGLLVGAYEKDGRFWSQDGTPLDFGHELLPDDLERISDNVMQATGRVPVLETAGIKKVINGPMIWTPDVGALLGPVPELKNYFVAGGVIPGFSQGAGLGLSLAQWILEGEPELDLFPLDVARFGDYADKRYTMARALDNYGSRYRIHFPLEERAAGRPSKLRPAYEKQKALGAVFGASFGWEYPLWYAPEGMAQEDHFSFKRPRWFEPVGEECRALREGVGLLDVSHFGKYEIKGPGAAAWLDKILANRLPKHPGKTVLSPMLNDKGGVIGDFTLTRISEDSFFMIGSGVAERYHWRWFNRFLPAEGVEISSLSAALTGFNLAGPKARAVLASLTDEDVSDAAFPFLTYRDLTLGGLAARAVRISFSGESGYEIYLPEKDQLALFELLLEKGAAHGIKPAGARALNSLRLEKGYGSWGREYSPEYSPYESSLGWAVKLDKGDFVGRQAAERLKQQEPRYQLACLAVEAEDADAVGGEPVLLNGEVVGQVSSAAYGHCLGRSLALAYLKADKTPGADAGNDAGYSIEILGEPRPAQRLSQAPYDPKGEKLRG